MKKDYKKIEYNSLKTSRFKQSKQKIFGIPESSRSKSETER